MAKEIKTKSTALMLIVIVAAILIIINLISLNFFSRFDLTDENIYSLSDSSKRLVSELDDRLTIRAYITEDLPAPHNSHARYIKDMLDDYKAYSNGNLQYEFIDPAKTEKEEEAMSYRIPAVQFNVFRNDKTEFIKAYKGLVLLYGDKQHVLPFIETTQNLEYEITLAIKKLTTTDIPFLGFTMGNMEPDMQQGLTAAYQLLQEEYRVQFINLDNVRNLPEQLDALFVVQPKEKLNAWELYLIDQFIMRGGKVSFLYNPFDVNISQAMVAPIDNGLNAMLRSYGIGVKDSLIVDAQCNVIPVTRDMGGFRVQSISQYPYFIKISNFNDSIPIVKDLNSLDMLFVSPLDLSLPLRENQTREILFSSSDMTGSRALPIDISPEKQYQQSDFTETSLPLGAVLSGSFRSYYANNETTPVYEGPDTMGTTPFPVRANETSDARIIVIGNGSFITDDFRRSNSGFVLLMNICDWLTQDKGMISIRSRSVSARALDAQTDGTKQFVKYLNIFAMPLLVILFGLGRWQYKRSLKKRNVS